eukprot:scaffold110730_cov19-Tisochrysis_lutea.AAC.1
MEQPNVRTMLASNQQCLDRLFKVAAGFLNEGAGKRQKRAVGSFACFVCAVPLGSIDPLVIQGLGTHCTVPSSSSTSLCFTPFWAPAATMAVQPLLVSPCFTPVASAVTHGGLETRTYGKRILFNIKMCLGSKADLDRLVSQVHPEMLARKVSMG